MSQSLSLYRPDSFTGSSPNAMSLTPSSLHIKAPINWTGGHALVRRSSRKSAGLNRFSRYACKQRFKRRRYMCPFHAASAMRDNSRQTDLKLPVCIRVAWFCHAPRLLSVTAKPRFESFRTTDVVGLPRSLPCGCHNRPPASAQFASPSAESLAAASSSLR